MYFAAVIAQKKRSNPVEGHLNPGLFNPGLFNYGLFNPIWFKNYWLKSPGLKSSLLKRLGLKGPGQKLGMKSPGLRCPSTVTSCLHLNSKTEAYYFQFFLYISFLFVLQKRTFIFKNKVQISQIQVFFRYCASVLMFANTTNMAQFLQSYYRDVKLL